MWAGVLSGVQSGHAIHYNSAAASELECTDCFLVKSVGTLGKKFLLRTLPEGDPHVSRTTPTGDHTLLNSPKAATPLISIHLLDPLAQKR